MVEIQRTPGGVAIVRGEDYKNSTPAATLKDVLDYVPGVFVQPKWGEDSRLSIRGSGLSRNFHLRGVQLYMDGIPINTADGYGDFQELDPTAYRYVEVYKGANALRYGAASLGGAINFVTPSGRDAPLAAFSLDLGSFGFARTQAQAAGAKGAWDGFITASGQRADGFRDHSDGHAFRGSGNIGYQITPDIETRFYFNGNSVRQRIPGSVTKSSALNTPQTAAVNNVLNDQQRNIDTLRFANKTTARFGNTTVEVGAFAVDRHLMHPIFQWLDYQYDDYGVFGRVTDDRRIGDLRNRFVAGVNVHNGKIDNQQFAEYPRLQGRAAVVVDRQVEEHLGLCRGLPVRAAERRRHRRHAVHPRHAQPAGSLPEQRQPVGGNGVQSVEPARRIALGHRSDLAGVRERLAQRRDPEFW